MIDGGGAWQGNSWRRWRGRHRSTHQGNSGAVLLLCDGFQALTSPLSKISSASSMQTMALGYDVPCSYTTNVTLMWLLTKSSSSGTSWKSIVQVKPGWRSLSSAGTWKRAGPLRPLNSPRLWKGFLAVAEGVERFGLFSIFSRRTPLLSQISRNQLDAANEAAWLARYGLMRVIK